MEDKKQALRNRMKTVREALAALSDNRQALIDNAVNGLLEILEQQGDADIVIGGYSPIQTEPDIPAVLDALAAKGKEFSMCLPRITDDNCAIAFKQYEKGDSLVAHRKFKVLEPKLKAKKARPTILIVPLLAFDGNGNRLGYGGGFYDKAIDRLEKDGKPIITVGIAYDKQQVERVPREKHDKSLDVVITQTRIMENSQGKTNVR